MPGAAPFMRRRPEEGGGMATGNNNGSNRYPPTGNGAGYGSGAYYGAGTGPTNRVSRCVCHGGGVLPILLLLWLQGLCLAARLLLSTYRCPAGGPPERWQPVCSARRGSQCGGEPAVLRGGEQPQDRRAVQPGLHAQGGEGPQSWPAAAASAVLIWSLA